MAMMWGDPISEIVKVNTTELWEIYNFTADAHPIHLHQVQFEVVNRQPLVTDADGISAASRHSERASGAPRDLGDGGPKTPSSSIRAWSPGSRPDSISRGCTSGTAISSTMKTTK